MRKYPYKKLAKYPHLMPKDVEVWEKFLDSHPKYFNEVEYDVHVGQGVTTPPEAPKEYAYDYKHLTKKRIDVVGHKGEIIFIVEIKPSAGLSAVGQAFGLSQLFRAENPNVARILPCIITDRIDKDIAQICERMRIVLLKA